MRCVVNAFAQLVQLQYSAIARYRRDRGYRASRTWRRAALWPLPASDGAENTS